MHLLLRFSASALVLLASTQALADDETPTPVTPRWDGTRLQLDAGIAVGEYHRTQRPLYQSGTSPGSFRARANHRITNVGFAFDAGGRAQPEPK